MTVATDFVKIMPKASVEVIRLVKQKIILKLDCAWR